MAEGINLDFVRIPEGEFLMGSDQRRDRLSEPDETPLHRLRVTDYYMMRYPVTNQQYQKFVEATGHRPPLFGWNDGKFLAEKADHPVVGVSFRDALEFAQWAAQETGLSVRLPTEPEWEKAARGPDGYLYPWGDTWQDGACNNEEARRGGTTPVDCYSPQGDSPYGVGDMGGNVQEWTCSLFGRYPYDPEDGREMLVYNQDAIDLLPKIRETGCTSIIYSNEATLDKSVIRGGSFREDRKQSRCAYRGWAAPMHRSDDTGFRLVYEA